MCESRQGVKQDLKEAVKWYWRAPDQEHAEALCNLGRMVDTERSAQAGREIGAAKLLRQAAGFRLAEAWFLIGRMSQQH